MRHEQRYRGMTIKLNDEKRYISTSSYLLIKYWDFFLIHAI